MFPVKICHVHRTGLTGKARENTRARSVRDVADLGSGGGEWGCFEKGGHAEYTKTNQFSSRYEKFR